jgi:hypothetical protein
MWEPRKVERERRRRGRRERGRKGSELACI